VILIPELLTKLSYWQLNYNTLEYKTNLSSINYKFISNQKYKTR